MMPSKLTSAVDILKDEGVLPLTKKSAFYFAKQTSIGRQLLYEKSVREVEGRMAAEESKELDAVLDTVLEIKPGDPPYQVGVMQIRDEIQALTKIVEKEQPETVLEIGTAKGGSFYIWSRYLDSVDRLFSLDLPDGKFGGGYDKRKTELFRKFSPAKKMEFIRADSHKESTYEEVSGLITDDVDFLFIDGDHTYEGVKQDFEMYRELVSEGGIIALHDIATHPDDWETVHHRRQNNESLEDHHLLWGDEHPECNVDQFWEELVEEYDTEEIISHPKQTWAGIGVVRV